MPADATEVTEDADIARIVAELRTASVALVAGSVTDLAGVTRAKYVPLRRLPIVPARRHGRVAVVERVLCRQRHRVHPEHRGGRRPADPHRPADLRLIDDGVAWAPGDLTTRTAPPPRCAHGHCSTGRISPRAKGLTAMVGAELECTMLAARRRPRVNGTVVAVRHPHLAGPVGVPRRPRQLRRARRAPVEQIHTEYGHDQLEVSLAPNTPVAAADAVVLRAHRDRPRRRPPRAANLVLPGALRGRGG